MNMRPDIDIEKAAQMWNDGFSAGMIAKAFNGISRNVIIGIANRNRNLFPNKAKTGIRKGKRVAPLERPKMSDEERQRRNKAQNAKRRAERESTRQTKTEAVAKTREDREERATQRRERGFTAAIDIPLQATGKELWRLASCECHWPVSDGAPYLFCAAVTTDKSDYCADHLERSLPVMANRRVAA